MRLDAREREGSPLAWNKFYSIDFIAVLKFTFNIIRDRNGPAIRRVLFHVRQRPGTPGWELSWNNLHNPATSWAAVFKSNTGPANQLRGVAGFRARMKEGLAPPTVNEQAAR